jgi:hypothetical protein
MSASTRYIQASNAYVEGIRSLFAAAAAPTRERKAGELAPAPDLAQQAEQLIAFSEQLTQAAQAQLDDPDEAVRAQASTRLLAKALTDWEVSAYLLQAAQDEEQGVSSGLANEAESGDSWLGISEERLQLLLGEGEVQRQLAQRDEVAPTDLPSARVELSNAVVDALALISERAARTGQSALGGLLGLGMAEVLQAAGLVGQDIAEALGQGEKVSRLYNAFRDLAVQSYDSLLVLLGRQLAGAAAKRVLDWLEKLGQGQLFAQLLEELYQTALTFESLRSVVEGSQADLSRYVSCIESVDKLNERYRLQAELGAKLLRAMAFLGTLPLAVLPHPKLLLAAAYIVLVAYAVLCGADYVDAPQLRVLNRVRGLRQIVEGDLASA